MSDTPPATPGSLDPAGYEAMKAETDETGEAEAPFIEVRENKYKTAEKIPGIVLLDLGVASDPSATQGEQLRAMRQFIHAAIDPEEVAKFEHFLRTANPIIDMEELNTVVEKLMAVVTARPTE